MPELPEAELSSDLDWMLRNPQMGASQVVEAIIRECYRPLTRFAWAVLEDRQAAEEAVEETVLSLFSKRERLDGEHTVKILLYASLYRECKGKLRRERLQRMIAGSWSGLPRKDKSKDGEGGRRASSIWHCLAVLPEEENLPILLHEGHDLSLQEIAAVLDVGEAHVARWLQRGQETLRTCFVADITTDRSIDEQVRAELHGLWPVGEQTNAQFTDICKNIEGRLLKQDARRRLLIYGQHLALAGLVTLVVLGIGWTANRLAQSNPDLVPVETVIVTKIVQVVRPTQVAPTSEPVVTPVPLSAEASEADLRERMLESGRYWTNLWVDALLIQHGPKGYVGAPLIRHEQIWISKPQYSLVLSAWANRDVDHVWFAADGKVYDVDLGSGRPFLYDYHGDRLPVYSALDRFISPAEIANEAHRLEIAGQEQVAGRDTLIVEWYSPDGVRAGRLWVDVATGVVLRWRQFQDDSNIVILEIEVTSIKFDARFPRGTFDRRKLSIDFAGEDLDDPQARRAALTRALVDKPPGHQMLDKIPPPEGFDPSQSRLVFQWNQPPPSWYNRPYLDDIRSPDEFGREIPVDVFAGRYYLGQIHLNPWSVICDRSADGQHIAYVTVTGRRNEAVSSLEWVDLIDLGSVSAPLVDTRPGWDIAFAPDNRQLAYQGCIGDQCGVYILDLETGESERVSIRAGEYLTWNPEGEQLAWIGYLPDAKVPGVFVRDMASGGVSYIGNLDAQSGELPEGSPYTAWGGVFPERAYGMDGCEEPLPDIGPPKANVATKSN